MQRLPAREGALGADLLGGAPARPSHSDQVGILTILAVTTCSERLPASGGQAYDYDEGYG